MPLAKNIKRYISLKAAAVVFLAIAVVISAGSLVFSNLNKEVVINYNEHRIEIKTMKSTVKEVLKQSGIELNDQDYVSLPLDTKLKRQKINTIDIESAVPIIVEADGKKIEIMTLKKTVKEALQDDPINLSCIDRIEGAKSDDRITANLEVKVVRVSQKLVSENEIIPRVVETRESGGMDKGQERIAVEGKDGVKEKLYRILYADNKEVARQLVVQKVVSEPIKKIVEIGTILSFTTSRGDGLRYEKVLNMRATAYTASFKDTGKSPGHPEFGITYTGIKAKRGIVAVDPKVIPLGTKLYIEISGPTPDYGYALAADIGSAVKGDIIDLYLDDQESVDQWGCKNAKVYILED